MASVKFQKGSEEWMMFTEFWKICQKHWQVEENENYWNELISDCNKFAENFKECTIAEKLIIAFLDNQDLILRNRKKN